MKLSTLFIFLFFTIANIVEASPVTIYQHCNYTGWSTSLEEGSYTLVQLQNLGFVNDDASSIQVEAGYEVDLYQHDQYLGSVTSFTSDDDCFVNENINDIVSSLVVRKNSTTPDIISKTFSPSSESFANPERGWIVHYFSHAVGDLNSLRNSNEKVSLVLLKIDISAYKNSAHIGQEKLNEIRTALQMCREAGVKALLRSAYAWDQVLAPDPSNIQQMATHVSDMRSIYHDFKDVIVAVEMGMFGPWGEMHSSAHSTNPTALYYPIKTDALRIIHNAYMNALPVERQVLVRRPHYIREIFGNSTPLSDSDAYSSTPQARTGYHNDAYLNSADDGGTFAHGWTRQQELNYIQQMTRHTFFGGETFGTPNGTYNNANNALYESRLQHMSYLNRDYYTPIYDAWGVNKDLFTRNLGYRLVLDRVSYTSAVAPGGLMDITLELHNEGFANLHNPRPVVLQLTNDLETFSTSTSINPRDWRPESAGITIQRQFHLPSTLTEGNWQVRLFLPDASDMLKTDSRFAVRFANTNTWNSDGSNSLFSLLVDSASGTGDNDSSFYEVGYVPPPTPTPDTSARIQNGELILQRKFSADLPFRQVFIDTDNNNTTGLAYGNIGADVLIENSNVYQHGGSGWSWSFLGSAMFSNEGLDFSWSVPLSLLSNTVSQGDTLIFTETNGGDLSLSSEIITIQ